MTRLNHETDQLIKRFVRFQMDSQPFSGKSAINEKCIADFELLVIGGIAGEDSSSVKNSERAGVSGLLAHCAEGLAIQIVARGNLESQNLITVGQNQEMESLIAIEVGHAQQSPMNDPVHLAIRPFAECNEVERNNCDREPGGLIQ
jgi:hypothetical protein